MGVDLASRPEDCFYCHGSLEGPLFPHACRSCGLPQPLGGKGSKDPFNVFQMEKSFRLDRVLIQRKFLELSRALHPDRFVQADLELRRHSLERMSLVNDAYRTLQSSDLIRDFLWKDGASSLNLERAPGDFELAEKWFEIQERVAELESDLQKKTVLEDFLRELKQRVELEEFEMTQLECEFEEKRDRPRTLEKMYQIFQKLKTMRSMLRDVVRLGESYGC